MKETYSIAVRGKSGRMYTFNFQSNAEHVAGWLAEGFNIEGPLIGWCPLWVQQIGLSLPWFWCQERFYDLRDAVFFWRKYTR